MSKDDRHALLLVAVNGGYSTAAETLITAGASTAVLDERGYSLQQVGASSHKPFVLYLETIEELAASLARTPGPDSPQFSVGTSHRRLQTSWERSSLLIKALVNPLKSVVKDLEFTSLNEDHEYPHIIRQLLDHGVDSRF